MRRCPRCAVGIEGAWDNCPLCGTPAAGEATASPLPAIPLRFSRRRVLRVLFLTSIAIILASLVLQLTVSRDRDGIGVMRTVWLGVITMWLVVIIAVRKRRNVAKGALYLVVLVELICVYWDYLSGWRGWSLTYTVPIVGACSIVALLITIRLMRIETGDHILYSGVTVLLGLVPVVFLGLGWVTNPTSSVVCGVLSLGALVTIQRTRGADVVHELIKRLHV